jgi:hypothetical protein
MTSLPVDAINRIGDTRRRAESDLQTSLRSIEGDDITPYLRVFTLFATALFDAEAEEFVGICDDRDSLEEILRKEVTSRIIESILPDRSLDLVRAHRPDSADRRPIVQEADSQTIHEEDPSGELTPAGAYVQGIHARHGYWERFMPKHIAYLIRWCDNARVREELSQVLQRQVFYWAGQFTLRVQTATRSHNGIIEGNMPTNIWESLRLGFMQLRADCAINPPILTAGRLTAIWTAQPAPGRWLLNHWNKKDGNGVRERFKWHAQSAAARLYFAGDGDDAVSFWLDQIKRDAPESHVRRQLIEAEGPDEVYSVEVLDICGLSADYCRKCEVEEIRSRMASTKTGSRKHLPRVVEMTLVNGNPPRDWQEVEIRFLSDERAQITFGDGTETRNYAEFGFEDRRTKKPNLAWVTLRLLAGTGGTLRQAQNGRKWATVEKRIQEIRKVLRSHFGLSSDPLPFVEGTGYRARFRISCAPSFRS